MELTLLILRLCLFAVAFCGVCCQLNRLFKQPAAFVPILTCCTLGCLLLIAGILNVLSIVPLLFILLGLYGFVFELVRGARFRWFTQPAIICLLAASVYFFIYFYGHYISASDDFNNWAIVVRVLLRYDRLPRFTDTVILFPSYPTGTAGFIYLVCKVLGSDSGGSLLFAQTFLLLCCFLPLFTLPRECKFAGYGVILVTVLILLTLNSESSIHTLYVDALLPIVCLAGMTMTFYHRNEMETFWPLLLPVGCFLAVVKSSGLYFSLVLAVLATLFIWPRVSKRVRWRCAIVLIAVPVCLLLLWNRHADLVFEGGLMTRHSSSLRYMLQQTLLKDSSEVLLTIRGFFTTLADFSRMKAALSTWLLIIGLAIFGRLSRVKSAFPPRAFLLSSLALYGTYLMGLLGMYIFNMPENTIESFTRYEHTILLLILGLCAIYCIEWFNALPKQQPARIWAFCVGTVAAVYAAFLLAAKPPISVLARYPDAIEISAKELDSYMPEHDKETRYLVYIWDGHKEYNYGHRLVHYTAYPAQSDIVSSDPDDRALLEAWPEHYDYLIPFWTDETYTAYAEAHGIDPSVKLWSAEAFLAVSNAPAGSGEN